MMKKTAILTWMILAPFAQRVAAQQNPASALKLEQPGANAVLGVAEVSVSGVYEGDLASVSCNGREGVVFGSRFVVQDVPLTEGRNRLLVKATDAGGQHFEAALDVICDLTTPEIRLLEPKQATILGVFRARLSGTVSDATAVTVRANGMPVAVQAGRFEGEVPLLEGPNAIRVEAVDAAGHVSEAATEVTVDATAPRIAVSQPASGTVTRQAAQTVSGRVEDATTASLSVNGKPVSLDADGRFSFTHQLVAQGKNTITLVARDKAGHRSDLALNLILDTRPPILAGIDPAPGGAGVSLSTPVIMRFSEAVAAGSVVVTLADGRVVPGRQSLQGHRIIFTPASALPDGAQIIARASGVADLAGNVLATPAESRFTTLDTTPPRELVLDPVPAATPRKNVTISGRTEPNARVRVGSRSARADKSGRFSVDFPLRPGTQNRIAVMAADATGNESPLATAAVDQQSGALAISAAVFQNNRVTITFTREVLGATVHAQTVSVRSADGVVAGQLATVGAQVEFTPDIDLTTTAFLLEITTGVTDLGANPLAYPYTRMFNRPEGGMTVTGEVYDDTTGLPVEGALVAVRTLNGSSAPSPAPSITTDVDGSSCTLAITKPGYTSASRAITSLSQLAETIFDARLTPRREGDVVVKPDGGLLAIALNDGAASIRLDVPAYGVPVERKINVTLLSGQGLAERLPMGWSPVLALDVSPAEISFGQAIAVTAETALAAAPFLDLNSAGALAFVRWDDVARQWRVLDVSTWNPPQSTLSASLTRGGQYAWVFPDTKPTVPPAAHPGNVLPGLPESIVIPSDATAANLGNPVPVGAGGTGSVRCALTAPVGITSGTPIQAKITGLYDTLGGQTLSFPLYRADLILYSYGSNRSLLEFRISPNRQVVGLQDLRGGTVTAMVVPFLAASGAGVVGAAGGRVAGDGGAEIEIPAGALSGPTTVTVKNMASALLPVPVPEGFRLVGAVELSLGGAVLTTPASLSVPPSVTVTDGAMLVTARVVSADCILSDSVTLANNRLATPGTAPEGFAFTGVREGGVYLFLEAISPMGYATGVVRDQGLPLASARVSAEGQGLTAIATTAGQYAQIAPAGTARLRAAHPTTGDEGTAEQALTAGALITVDIALQPTGPRVVGQSPSSGATNVPLATRVQIIFSEAVSADSLTPQTFYVTGVPGTITLSADGLLAEFKPAQDFASSQTFTVNVKGTIKDLRGTPMGTDYTSSFTTRDVIPPTYDLKKIRVVLPTNGVIRVIGEPGAIEPGATIWLFNERSGASVSTQGLSDGSFDISIPAIEGDRVRIRVIDLASNEIQVTPDVYTTPDGRGVQLDSGAHSYITPDGFGIATDLGTFPEPIIARLDPITDTNLLLPDPDGLARLSAFRLDLEGYRASKELDLSMPAPTNLPPDAQLFIAQEVFVLGERKLMVRDTCAVRDGRIETNSPPWEGIKEGGTVYFQVNVGPIAFVTGYAPGVYAAVSIGDLVYIVEPNTNGWFSIPVRAGRGTTPITIRDAITGTLIFGGSVDVPTSANQEYIFAEPLTKDARRPQLLQAGTASIVNLRWFGSNVSTSKIKFVADGGGVRITGQSAPQGLVYVFRYTIDPLTQAERVEKTQASADDSGAFDITVTAVIGDQLLVAAEQGHVEVDPTFVLDFGEAVQGEGTRIDDSARILDRVTNTLIPCVVQVSSSNTRLTVRPASRLLEEHRYELQISNLKDLSGNLYALDNALLLPFRTRKTTTLGIEETGRVSGTLLYGKYLFAACNEDGLKVIDVSDPGDLRTVGAYVGTGEVRGVALYRDALGTDRLVIVGGGTAHPGYIKILDITDPTNPTQWKSQIISYALGLPAGPMPIPMGKPSRVKVAGDYAFVAVYGAGMLVVNLTQMQEQTEEYLDCIVGRHQEDWISELEVWRDGETVRVLLLVDYFGLEMLNATVPSALNAEWCFAPSVAQMLDCAAKRAEGGTHFNGLAVVRDYEYDADNDARVGEDEDQPVTGDFAFVTVPAEQSVLVIEITGGNPKLVGKVKLPNATALGAIAFSAKERMLYVLDAQQGLLRISMLNPALFSGVPETLQFTDRNGDGVDDRFLGAIPTAGRPRFGLIIDERLNLAYAGDLEQGLMPIKLGLPRLRLAVKSADKFVEPRALLPWGLGPEQYAPVPSYPAAREIYVVINLPMKADQNPDPTLKVRAGLRSALQGAEPATLPPGQASFVPPKIEPADLILKRYKNPDNSEVNPTDEAYGLFVSDPIRLTLNPKEPNKDPGTQHLTLLSGDMVEAYLDPETYRLFAGAETQTGYLTKDEASAVVKRVPSVRAHWTDKTEATDPTPEPAQNPSIGLVASIPGLVQPGTCGVFLHSGEAFVEETDLAVTGRGLDFALVRRYESQAVYSGPLGWGWDFNYHRCVQELPNGDIYYFNGLGRRDLFKAKRTGPAISGYEAPEGVFAELKRRADGVWTLVFPGLYTEIFDQYGRLSRIQDRNDNALEFYYDAGGRLTAVIDTMARLYTFEYNLDDGTAQSGRLRSVSDYSGRKIEYEYDANGDLVAVKYGERVRRYAYTTETTNIKLAHNLVSVIDPKGQAALQVTYSGDSVVAEMINGVNASVSAGELAAAWTDGLGHTRSYALDGKGHVTAVTEAGATTQYAYNSEGLVTSITYPLGNKRELTYDSQNPDRRAQANLLQARAVPDARGGDLLITAYTYQPWTNQVASVVDPKGNSTRFTLDTQGNVKAIAAPDNTTTQITRDKYGRVAQQTDPLGKTTVSEYYPETSPGGATQQTPPSRPLDSSGGGYLAKVVSDPAGDNLASEFAYDVRGNLLSQKDGEGVVTNYTVDAYNQATSVTAGGADGTVSSSLSYDANANVTSRTARGITETYTYNQANLPVTLTKTGGTTTQSSSFTYDANWNLTSATDPKNVVEDFTYDALDRLIETKRAALSRAKYTYDANGNLISSTDGENQPWTRAYDGHDRLVRAQDPLANVVSYGFDNNSNPILVTGPEGFSASFVYDPMDRMLERTQASIRNRYAYNANGALTQYTSPNGNNWGLERTGAGLVRAMSDPLGNRNEFGYDNRGLPIRIEEKEAGGRSLLHTASYNALGQLQEQNDALNRRYSTHFDTNARPDVATDPESGVSALEYDGLGRVTKALRKVGNEMQPVTYERDANGNVTAIIDALGNRTTYVFDNLDRLTSVTYPDQKVETYSYNNNDQITTIQMANGTTVALTYDAAGRMTQRVINAGAAIETFGYDGLGRTVRAENTAATVQFTYDPAGRLTKETQTIKAPVAEGGNKTYEITYGHDAEGNRTSMTYPSGKLLAITPDALNRIDTIMEGDQRLTKYGYEGPDKIVQKLMGPLTMTAQHDNGKRPVSFAYSANGQTLVNRNNQWNLRDLKTVDEDSGKRTEYAYDEAQRITSKSVLGKQTTYALDATDSIKQIAETEGGITTSTDFTTNNRHQVTAFDGHTLSYDANGNLEQVRDADGKQTNYFYDWRNQLITVQDNQGQLVEFAYDALGRRVEKRVTKAAETSVHRYVWDGWKTIEERNLADQVTSRYVYGSGIDEPVQIEKRNPSTGAMDTFIPMQDTNGNVLGLADATGNLIERVEYTTYGKPTFIYDHEPPKVDQVRLVDNTLRIRFSEPVDQTKAQSAIKVKQGADILPGALTFSENDRLAIFTPTNPFPQGVALTVDITTDVEDLTANRMVDPFTAQFTPTGVNLLIYDRGPPKVQSIKLIVGAIRIDFDEEIDPATIANSVDLLDDQNATLATTLAAQGDKALEVSPTSGLTSGAQYTLKIKTTLADLSGKPLSNVFEQRFVFETGNKLLYDLPSENEHTASSVGNTTTFQGRDYSPEIRLLFFRHRYFSPELGRFIQPDPMGYADSMNSYQGFANNPVSIADPLGLAGELIGYRYVARGQINGIPVTYVGSTARELRDRIPRHRWESFLKDPGTTIEVTGVYGEPDVQASARGSLRSAKNEALRAIEQEGIDDARRSEEMLLNEREAAKRENVGIWKDRHKVVKGEEKVGKMVSGRFVGLAMGLLDVLDAYSYAKEKADARYNWAPYTLQDKSGVFTLHREGSIRRKYFKSYVSGTAEGQSLEIGIDEYLDLTEEAEALWGTTDWLGRFVPGLLVRELHMEGEM